MAAAVLSPATTLRLNPFYATARFLSFRRKTLPTTLLPSLLKPIIPTPQNYTHYYLNPSFSGGRKFSSVISAKISPENAVERQKDEVLGSDKKVGKFRKRLRVVDIKGGVDEGLDRLGENLVVQGWIRTLRVQSSVTFIEVNDGSCLSNMQCVVGSDAEGYDQVENGLTTTGASVCVEGILVASQGSKQKVELKVEKLTTVIDMANIGKRAIHYLHKLSAANIPTDLIEKGQNRVIDASLTLIRERAKLKGELVRALGGAVASSSLLGIPLGHNSSFLQGPAFAPPRIREAIWDGSTNSTTEEGKELEDPRVLTDVGDVPVQELRDCGVNDDKLMHIISESVKLVMEEVKPHFLFFPGFYFSILVNFVC